MMIDSYTYYCTWGQCDLCEYSYISWS